MTNEMYYNNDRSEMFAYLPSSARVFLDVGCGKGNFAKAVKESVADAEVWGIEIFKEVGEQAIGKIDHVILASAEAALSQLPDGYFDCIIFNDSLEHFVDPYTYLASIRKKLKPNAYIVASIPNVRYYKVMFDLIFKADWRYAKWGVLDKTHLRFFTRKSMLRMFEEAGYRVVKSAGLRVCRKVKIRLLSWLTFGLLNDIRFMQIAIVAEAA